MSLYSERLHSEAFTDKCTGVKWSQKSSQNRKRLSLFFFFFFFQCLDRKGHVRVQQRVTTQAHNRNATRNNLESFLVLDSSLTRWKDKILYLSRNILVCVILLWESEKTEACGRGSSSSSSRLSLGFYSQSWAPTKLGSNSGLPLLPTSHPIGSRKIQKTAGICSHRNHPASAGLQR